MTHETKQSFSLEMEERASAFTSKASITVEASFAATLFFLAVMCLVCMFEVMALQIQIKSSLHSVGKEIAAEAYCNKRFFTSTIEKCLVEAVGAERLDRSMIMGGSNGIDCSGTRTYAGSTIVDLCAYYQIELPVFGFRIPAITREEIIRVKGWSGAETSFAAAQNRELVFVTDYGLVYHCDMKCTYLDLSIKAVPSEQVKNLRNEQGRKYSACEICGRRAVVNVYVTEQGLRYHSTLDCRGIKRTVYAVPKSEVYGMGGCSKCVR